MTRWKLTLSVILGALAFVAGGRAIHAQSPPVKLGLCAAVSGGSAAAGEAIKRGLLIGIKEINAKGGVLLWTQA